MVSKPIDGDVQLELQNQILPGLLKEVTGNLSRQLAEGTKYIDLLE
jgi:hypothetical protein